MTKNYQDILNESTANIPVDVILPQGGYVLRVSRANAILPKEEGQKLKVMVNMTVKGPLDDVDETEFRKIDRDDVASTELLRSFNLATGYDYKNFYSFATACGIETQGKTKQQVVDALKGCQVQGYVKARTYENKDGASVTTNDVSNFAAVE